MSEKKHLCIILNMASHYRKEIYEMLDKEYDCDWFTGETVEDIKTLDMSGFRNPVTSYSVKKLHGYVFWQYGLIKLLKKNYDYYIVSEDIRCLSSWLFALLGKIGGKKVIAWTHGWYGKETNSQKVLKKIFYRLFYKILLYGNHAKCLMVKEGFNSDKLIVIHNSLAYSTQLSLRQSIEPSDIYTRHFENNSQNIVFVGRLTVVKKLDMILHAVKEAQADKLDLNVTFIGGGVDENRLKSCAAELGIDNIVWFYGPCYDEAVLAEMIYNADLCVSPGNVGLTAIHSLMFGTPVVSNDDFAHQMPEYEAIIPDKTGAFFNANDTHSLYVAIKEWFSKDGYNREKIREDCFYEIDSSWTPQYQMNKIAIALNS